MYAIQYATGVEDDLRALKPYHRNEILDAVEQQLSHQPMFPTRNRKPLEGLVPPWDHVPPVWELRIGAYRVYYDVDQAASVVKVRAVRHKPAHMTTEEIL